MDWAEIHIAINHFPIILAVVGVLSMLFGLLSGRRGPWLYGSVSVTLAAITVIPSYFTGEPAADFLHRPWYIARGTIGAHERSALISTLLMVLAGLASAVTWRRVVRYPRELVIPGWLRAAALLTALAATASIGYTGWLGGAIVHRAPALQGPAPAGWTPPAPPPR